MEISLGDKVRINGEEVPEYLLKALYENLNLLFNPPDVYTTASITAENISTSKCSLGVSVKDVRTTEMTNTLKGVHHSMHPSL